MTGVAGPTATARRFVYAAYEDRAAGSDRDTNAGRAFHAQTSWSWLRVDVIDSLLLWTVLVHGDHCCPSHAVLGAPGGKSACRHAWQHPLNHRG
jgi:hypothetical protein